MFPLILIIKPMVVKLAKYINSRLILESQPSTPLKAKAILISEGEHNGIIYTGEELKKAAPSFDGVAVRLDHSNSVKDVVGKVHNPVFKESPARIEGELDIVDKDIANKIRLGLITGVSCGLDAKDLDIGDKHYATDIRGRELSLVTEPADENAQLIELLNSKKDNELKHILSELNKKFEVRKLADESAPGIKNEPDTLPPAKPKDDMPVAADAVKGKAEAEKLQEGETTDQKIDELIALMKELIAKEQAEPAPEEKPKPEVAPEEKKPPEELSKKVEELSKQLTELKEKGTRKVLTSPEGTDRKLLFKQTRSGLEITTASKDESPMGGHYGMQF